MDRRPASVPWLRWLAALIALALLLVPATASAAQRGADGIGDRLFPQAGNGGIDAERYFLDLDYDPATGLLDATTRIRVRATQRLRTFDLDFRGPAISSVRVGGSPAAFRREGQELVIRPDRPLADGDRFSVAVSYAGTPGVLKDPEIPVPMGWIRTDDGAFTPGEPVGAPQWFPCNDHPSDKASYEFRIGVPRGYVAVANGKPSPSELIGAERVFHWRERRPMASYLAMVNIGRGGLTHGHADGLPYWNFVDWREREASAPVLGGLGSTTRIERRMFGAYPFGTTGAAVDHDVEYPAALETQTRPIYPDAPTSSEFAHELAHQWFGNSVSVARWRDIWLNEGFAEFGEWMWRERTGQQRAQELFKDFYENGEKTFGQKLWNPPPGRPGSPAGLFGPSVYIRGAMALQALRTTLGPDEFFPLLRAWTRTHRYGNATVGDFRRFAERETGVELSAFFDNWLYRRGKPVWPMRG